MLNQLSAGPRTRAQLTEVLTRRDLAGPVAEAVLDRFTELGYIDDEAFARAWVRERAMRKALSRRALTQELARKGLDQAVIASAVDSLDPADEEAAALALVSRKLPATAELATEVRVRRLVGVLGRKGHAPGLALRVVREALRLEHGDRGP